MTLLEIARGYVKDGLSCFPVEYGGKRPDLSLIESQLPYYRRMPTDDELGDWFGTWALASEYPPNLGIACGEVSGNLCVLDFDSRELYAAWLGFLGVVPRTRTVVTAKGNHVYLRTDKPCRSRKLPGFDLKAEGGYVVAPPSYNTERDWTYQWQTDTREIVQLTAEELAESLQAFFLSQGIDFSEQRTHEPGSNWISELLDAGAREGERNSAAVALMGYLGKRTHDDIADALMRCWNDARNKPPLPERELDQLLAHWHKAYDDNPAADPIPDRNLISIFGVE